MTPGLADTCRTSHNCCILLLQASLDTHDLDIVQISMGCGTVIFDALQRAQWQAASGPKSHADNACFQPMTCSYQLIPYDLCLPAGTV